MPTVLVVDGERAAFDKLRAVCEDSGLVAKWAGSFVDAVRAVHQEVPAVILIDSGTPGAQMSDMVSLFRQDPCTARIPLVVLCEPNGDSLAAGWNSEADMVLEKPVDALELFAVVRQLIAMPQR